jgi:hypothetical protein
MKHKRVVILKLIVLTLAVWGTVILFAPQSELPVVTAAAQTTMTPVATNHDKLVWLDDYSAAIKEAKATGKPIFLEFRCAP